MFVPLTHAELLIAVFAGIVAFFAFVGICFFIIEKRKRDTKQGIASKIFGDQRPRVTYRKSRKLWLSKKMRLFAVYAFALLIGLAAGSVLLSEYTGTGAGEGTHGSSYPRIYNGGIRSDYSAVPDDNNSKRIKCFSPYIHDGDTFECGERRVRLYNIDAPEMPGHCRSGRKCTPGDPYAAKKYLTSLTRGTVICRQRGTDTYGRVLASCEGKGQDLSCAMVQAGHAVQRYAPLSCP